MPRTYLDPGEGNAAASLHYYRAYRHRLGDIVDAELAFPGYDDRYPYLCVLRDRAGNEMWLSGVTTGYAGPATRAARDILTDAGFAATELEQLRTRTRLTLHRDPPARRRPRRPDDPRPARDARSSVRAR